MVFAQGKNAKSLFTIDLATTRLLTILARIANNYELADILPLTISAVIAGAKGWEEIEGFGVEQSRIVKAIR
ncbi:hypothetical protein [Photorhabdus africana]|uniref:hypothetical protein n=1 Tax=Photorhabdus africana TaxID=3097554 RepID=UPI002B40368B|nr:hypothetical protein [Photorhabdus sp. CRI-LC]